MPKFTDTKVQHKYHVLNVFKKMCFQKELIKSKISTENYVNLDHLGVEGNYQPHNKIMTKCYCFKYVYRALVLHFTPLILQQVQRTVFGELVFQRFLFFLIVCCSK